MKIKNVNFEEWEKFSLWREMRDETWAELIGLKAWYTRRWECDWELVREFISNMQPYNKTADHLTGEVRGTAIVIAENVVADALTLNNMNALDILEESKGWSKNIRHMMKEDHVTKDQGYSIAKAEPSYITRLFAINESLMLKKKLTYASLELLVVIARAEKASGRVDWARLVFSNLKRELNAINREQIASSKCAPVLTQILKYWLQTKPIAIHKAIQDVPSSSRKKSGNKKEELVEVGRKRITRATEDAPQKRTRTGATTRASQTERRGRTSTRRNRFAYFWEYQHSETRTQSTTFRGAGIIK